MNDFFRLISQLEGRVKTVGDEISSLEGVDRRVEELGERVTRLARHLAGLKVWHQDHAETETKLAVRKETFLITFTSGHYISKLDPVSMSHQSHTLL